MNEKDLEAAVDRARVSRGSTPPPLVEEQEGGDHDHHSTTTNTTTHDHDNDKKNFAPIRPATATSKSRRHSLSSTLRRERSNNGYGVEDLIDHSSSSSLEAPDDEPATPQDPNAGQEVDPFEVTWDGGDLDPLCPRSMPTWRKWTIITITSIGSFAVTHGSAIYTASYEQMNAEFHTSRLVATIGLSLYVLGIALGPFWSPLAEFYGRRPIYLASFVAFIIWLIPSAVAKNIETMLVARFFQGLAGSAFLSVSGGTVSDMFVRDKMLMPMAIFSLAPFVGPSTGPFVGGIIVTYANWRVMHYYLLVMSGVVLLSLALFVPETYHPVLLKRKAVRLRKETKDDRWFAPIERSNKSIPVTVALSLLRPFQILMYEPMAVILNVYTAVLLGLLYLFFGAFPLIFRTNHGFNAWQVGLTFMGLLVSMVIACLTTPFWNRVRFWLIERREKKTGILKDEPEDQLPQVIFGAPLITGGLFWFGFTSVPEIHWIVPVIGSAVFGLGMSYAFTGVFTFLVAAYPRYAASALASNALVRCSFAAAFPLFGYQMYEALGFQWATGLLAFITLALLPFPYIFFRFGKRIRARSRYATSS
ncbi:major facilitator superfamily domain-containing protein [Podospora australis]|uniref:Major facilitator superfamily domain-containing protein n=1 Tax=Podospora australis TaxID=1536484 RepID=A0AAN6WQF6_9PEZI|nr:major facilitator superfamily domain-containing protein [Podospora australis]